MGSLISQARWQGKLIANSSLLIVNSQKLIHFPLESRVYSSELQAMQRRSTGPPTLRLSQWITGPVNGSDSVLPITLIGGGSRMLKVTWPAGGYV